MGMIARVRQRVRQRVRRAKKSAAVAADATSIDEERTAQSVCLLSAVLLLPYCPRGPLPLLPSPAPLLYSALVLPIVFSANYRYPVWGLKTLLGLLRGSAKGAWCPLSRFLRRVYAPIDRVENVFLGMKNISVMANQIVFLLLADRVLLSERPKTTCLYTLVFYNVIAYCVGYVQELLTKEDWSPYVTLTERSRIKHLAMSTTKIVLEWTKAVTFLVTLTFVVLVFGLEQGLERYKPTSLYGVTTWIYYSATEKVFVEMLPTILRVFRVEALESMEELYAPVMLRFLTIGASVLFSLAVIPTTAPRGLVPLAIYLNVYLKSKELANGPGWVLRRELRILSRYERATLEEIERFDDVCAVCLCGMTNARITPCRHLFHAECLRRCLEANDACPMCKRELKFD